MISNLAFVDPDAKIGKNVTVQPFAYIEADVEIGDNTVVAANASVLNGARVGAGCHIHSGAVVSGIPQDLKFDGEYSLCIVGDGTVVRESATINRGTKARGKTVVGKNCLIMAYAHVAHDCVIGDRVILVNNVSVAGEVEIGDWAILGGHVAVHQFVRIGAHVMVAGGSLIGKDVPAYITAGHSPLQYVGLNVIGLRRRGFTNEQINEIQDIYRILFQSGKNYSNACEDIESTICDSQYKTEILSFVKQSKRGLLKQYSSKNIEDIAF